MKKRQDPGLKVPGKFEHTLTKALSSRRFAQPNPKLNFSELSHLPTIFPQRFYRLLPKSSYTPTTLTTAIVPLGPSPPTLLTSVLSVTLAKRLYDLIALWKAHFGVVPLR